MLACLILFHMHVALYVHAFNSTCSRTNDARTLYSAAAQLEVTQSRLLDVGSAVATPADSSSGAKLQRTAFGGGHTTQLEAWIDEMDAELPPLKNFILPGGACREKLSKTLGSLARAFCLLRFPAAARLDGRENPRGHAAMHVDRGTHARADMPAR